MTEVVSFPSTFGDAPRGGGPHLPRPQNARHLPHTVSVAWLTLHYLKYWPCRLSRRLITVLGLMLAGRDFATNKSSHVTTDATVSLWLFLFFLFVA
jgi:hypothetical protein